MPESTSIRDRLQSRLRAERSASPELRRNYRIAVESRRISITTIVVYVALFLTGGPLLFVACPLMFILVLNQFGGPVCVLAQAGLWTLAAGFAFAEILLKQLHSSSHHACYAHLPIPDHTIANDAWKRTACHILLALYPAGLAYGVLAYVNRFDFWQWLIALGISSLHYCLIVFVGTWLVVCLPRWKHYVFAIGLAIVLFFSISPNTQFPGTYATALMFLPTCWPGAVVYLSVMEGLPQGLALILPLAGIVYGIIPFRKTLISSFKVSEFIVVRDATTVAELDGALSGADRWYWRVPGQPDPTLMLEPTEAGTRIRSQGMTQRRLASSGWVERIVSRFLSPHQQSLISFLYGESPQWSIAGNYVVVLSMALAVGRIYFPAIGLSPIPIVVLSVFGSWTTEQCRGAELRRCGNSFVARFAEYPIRSKDVTNAVAKVLTVRSLILGLLLLPISLAWYGVNGIAFSAVASLAAFVGITWNLTYRFSMGFTFPSRRRDAILAVMIGCSAVFGTWSGVIVAAVGWRRNDALFLGGLCLIVAATCGIQWLVKWMIDSGKIDLLHSRPSLYSQLTDHFAVQRMKFQTRQRWAEARRRRYGPFWRLKWLFGYAQ